MNCKKTYKLLPGFIEKNLSKEDEELVKNHLSSCKNCSVLYRQLSETMSLLKPGKEISEHAFYYTSLKQKMENRLVQKSSFRTVLMKKVLQPAIYLGALILAVYIGILIGSSPAYYTAQNESEDKSKEDYLEVFADYQYLNDFEFETNDNLFIGDSTVVKSE